MADTEPTKNTTTSSAELRWPDPTRPIINERNEGPGYTDPADGQHEGSDGPVHGDESRDDR